jgi:acrosin
MDTSRHVLAKSFQLLGLTSLIWGIQQAISPFLVHADTPLTRADVESIYNQVEFIPRGQSSRPASLSDWLTVGDALRTALDSRAELRFNDGSLARVGERATFWFVPNTRDFRLSNGTALFLIPPGRGPSTIQTPSAVTGVQGTALVVRHISYSEESTSCPESWNLKEEVPLEIFCELDDDIFAGSPGRTIVMVLTDNPNGPVQVTTPDGTSRALTAGDMAVIEGNSIQVMEFNLSLFYQTSNLAQGLNLDNPNAPESGMPTDPVRQETLDGLRTQSDFSGSYFLSSDVLAAEVQLAEIPQWFVDSVVATDMPSQSTTLSQASSELLDAGDSGRSGNSMSSRIAGNYSNIEPYRYSLPAGAIEQPSTGQSSSSMASLSGLNSVTVPVNTGVATSQQAPNQSLPNAPAPTQSVSANPPSLIPTTPGTVSPNISVPSTSVQAGFPSNSGGNTENPSTKPEPVISAPTQQVPAPAPTTPIVTNPSPTIPVAPAIPASPTSPTSPTTPVVTNPSTPTTPAIPSIPPTVELPTPTAPTTSPLSPSGDLPPVPETRDSSPSNPSSGVTSPGPTQPVTPTPFSPSGDLPPATSGSSSGPASQPVSPVDSSIPRNLVSDPTSVVPNTSIPPGLIQGPAPTTPEPTQPPVTQTVEPTVPTVPETVSPTVPEAPVGETVLPTL